MGKKVLRFSRFLYEDLVEYLHSNHHVSDTRFITSLMSTLRHGELQDTSIR